MKFKNRNLRDLADIIIGDNKLFPYRSSSYITRFFEECDLEFVHDGSTRWAWTSNRLEELLSEPQSAPNTLPQRFVQVFRVLMQKTDAADGDPNRFLALEELNKPMSREGYEAFYAEDNSLYFRHIGTKTISASISPHRPFTQTELQRRDELQHFLDSCSEDNLIEEVLLPLFRQLGFHRISPSHLYAKPNCKMRRETLCMMNASRSRYVYPNTICQNSKPAHCGKGCPTRR